MGMKSYRDLLVWQKAMVLVEETYRLTADLPKNEEFGLKSQMRRAAVSVPSNISEGQSRNQPREFLQFLHRAMGSLSELETQLEVAVRLKILSPAEAQNGCGICREVGKMLQGLGNSTHVR
jgi:four helix bundle protein